MRRVAGKPLDRLTLFVVVAQVVHDDTQKEDDPWLTLMTHQALWRGSLFCNLCPTVDELPSSVSVQYVSRRISLTDL
ncbi:hypothetical protein F2P81_012729 [Scophthalmus maximus]|uniref:Uncharacterized protein n=1 Tax=Scophthalmus maximus TaxID=52904 RepID=A0A6A4SV92_SCOMX|nr:hypothetical protein F2P81_012729 [Scophthalmus maximus]